METKRGEWRRRKETVTGKWREELQFCGSYSLFNSPQSALSIYFNCNVVKVYKIIYIGEQLASLR